MANKSIIIDEADVQEVTETLEAMGILYEVKEAR